MGLGGLITGTMGLTGNNPKVGMPSSSKVSRDYLALMRGYTQAMPDIFKAESTWKPKYNDLAMGEMRRSVPGFTNIMSSLQPEAMRMVQGMRDPGTRSLMDTLTHQAQAGLDSGTQLDPGLERLFTQGVRGGQAARGMGFGPSDVLEESMGMTELGQNLRNQRQGFAQNVAGMDLSAQNQESGNTMNIMAEIMGGANAANGGSGPSLIPSNQSYDMQNTAYNARAAKGIADANSQTAMLQGFNSFD